MSKKDAYMFPVIGSCVLFGMYMLFKLFSKEYINMLLTAYFLLFGLSAITATLAPWCAVIIGERMIGEDLSEEERKKEEEKLPYRIHFSIPFVTSEPIDWRFGNAEAIALVLSLGLSLWYAVTKNWIANNIFGFSFALQGVALISPGSYSVGAIMLAGLFFYDIFWVFGTDVMVTVAKNFDAPIKVVFPKNLTACIFSGDALEFSMLGLGDIVIPGIFIALLLRFDRERAEEKKSTGGNAYFLSSMLGYFLGLLTTIVVMHVFEHAQPALLYLVPACLLFSFIPAVIKGEVKELLAYSEEIEEDDSDDTDNADKDDDNKSEADKKNE